MQEELERKAIAITINAAKLSGRTLAKVAAMLVRQIQKEQQKAQMPHGRQPVHKLMNHRAATNTIPLDGGTRLFDRVARKWNVDYSFHKVGPKKYLLLFKSGQADAITAALSEYAKRAMARSKSRQPSIRQDLQRYSSMEAQRPREQVRTKEAVRDER